MTFKDRLKIFYKAYCQSMRWWGFDFSRPQFQIVTTLFVIAAVAIVASAVFGVISAFQSPKPARITFGTDGTLGPRYGTFGPLDNTVSNELAIPVLYGEMKLAGNVIWQSDPGDTVSRIIGLCEGEIFNVADVRVNDNPINDVDTPGSNYTVYKGTADQGADSRLPASLRPDMEMHHLAQMAVTLKVGEKVKGGNPTLTAVCQGLLVKTWQGGQWTAAKSYSRNPAACVRDFLTNPRYGLGVAESHIDDASFGQVYEYCEEIINPSGLYQPDANTLLLLYGDGDQGSATIVDSSPSPKTMTQSGDVIIDQTQKVFGSGSMLFPGSASNFVQAASTPSFAVGTGDFTVEFFVKMRSHSREMFFFRLGSSTSNLAFSWHTTIGGRLDFFLGGTHQSTTFPSIVGKWLHVAVVRKSGVVRIYFDGRQKNSDYSNSASVTAGDLKVGGYESGAGGLDGWMEGFRFSNVARYSANFDPPVPEEPRYLLDYVMDSQRPAQDLLNDLLATFGGFIVYSGSSIKLKVEKRETITQYFGDGSTTKANASFDPNNIVKDSFSWNLPSVDDRPNRIKVQWVDPDQNYVKVYTQVDDRIDQDERNVLVVKEVSLLGITRFSQASRMAKSIMTRAKYAATAVQFAARLESIHCEIGDVIAITHQAARWTRKLMRITDMQELENEMIQFTCSEYNDSIYDDHQSSAVLIIQQPSGPNLYAPLSDVTDLQLLEDNFTNKDGVFVTNILASWTPVSADQVLRLDRHLIQISTDGTTYRDVAFASGDKSSYRIVLGNVQTGTTFFVRIKTISDRGAESVGTAGTVTIEGKRTPPSDVEDFSVVFAFDHIAMSWSAIDDEDLFGYEIRVGNSNSTWETATIVTTEVLGTKFDLFNFTRGAKKFFIKAIDNSANYSENAAQDSINIGDIPESNVVVSFDLWSRIKVLPHPLQGTLSADLDRIPSNDFDPTYNRLTLQPKTALTWLERQQDGGTWAALQASSFQFGNEDYVTTEQSYETEPIDLGAVFNADVIVDLSTFSSTNLGFISVQISVSEDGLSYDAYRTYTAGQYNARFIKFKILIQATDIKTRVRLASAMVTIDVPDRYQRFTNQPVTALGTTFNLTGFTAVKAIVITTVNAGSNLAPDYDDANLPNSFTVRLYDTSNVAQPGNVDIYVSGY